MGSKLRVAAIQLDCAPAPVTARLERAAGLITQAAEAGARLAVMPELFNTGYEYHPRNYALAEPIDGQTVTWMQAQAARHGLHLAGTLILLDGPDIYNAAVLAAPDGRLWRYAKHYVPFWERAYFRGGDAITVADTDLGRLGMLICWDQYHPDLWADYAGQVDAVLVMSCPGDVGTSDLHFPDGLRAKFLDLVGPPPPMPDADESSPTEETPEHPAAAWIGVPVIESSATGRIRTRLPLIETFFPGSPLEGRASQAADMIMECGFPPATQIANGQGAVLARGSAIGDAIVLAEIDILDAAPTPPTAEPVFPIAAEMYQLSDEIVPAMMVPLYREGARRQWGTHMAPD